MSANTYETVFIAEPEISNDQVDQLLSKMKQAITANQGEVTAEDRWGKRRMAYAINGHREGFYVVLSFKAEAGAVLAVEHLYNVTDSVFRHLTTRVIKKNKVFAPRRERPAGAPEGNRYGSRPGSNYRGSRPSSAPAPAAAPAAAAAPVAAPVAEPAAPAPAAAPSEAPKGGTPT